MNLNKLKDFLGEKGTKLSYSDEVIDYIAKESYSDKFGARNMRRFIERHIEDKIANVIIDNYGKTVSGIYLSVKDNDIAVDYLV